MATLIAKWKANDGSEWSSEADARERDDIIDAVGVAMLPIGTSLHDESGCDFANGGGYVQHSAAAVRQARLNLHAIASAGPLKSWIDRQKREHGKSDESLALETHPSWQCRMLDGGCVPLERAYVRICCIDAQHREWGQPYFASNPSEAKQVRLR